MERLFCSTFLVTPNDLLSSNALIHCCIGYTSLQYGTVLLLLSQVCTQIFLSYDQCSFCWTGSSNYEFCEVLSLMQTCHTFINNQAHIFSETQFWRMVHGLIMCSKVLRKQSSNLQLVTGWRLHKVRSGNFTG